MNGIFVIGTDTGAGKTMVGVALGIYLKESGLPLRVIKPFETGCVSVEGELIPQDGYLYRLMLPLAEPIEEIVPFRYSLPLAPLQSSRLDQKPLDYAKSLQKLRHYLNEDRFFLLEGAGGLMVPLEENIFNLDLLADLKLPALLVAPNRLGTINHTLLTLQALDRRGIATLGVILNDLDGKTEQVREENRGYFLSYLGDRYLGEFPYLKEPAALVARLPEIIQGEGPTDEEISRLRRQLGDSLDRAINGRALLAKLKLKG